MVEEGRQVRIAILGQDDPGAVVQEAVDHDPVKAGQEAEFHGGARAQVAKAAGPLEAAAGHFQSGQDLGRR